MSSHAIGVRGIEGSQIGETSRGVAQPGSAPALGAGSRRFKSSRPDQVNTGSHGQCYTSQSGTPMPIGILPMGIGH